MNRKNSKAGILDLLVDLAVVIAPLSLLPQLLLIWKSGDDAGVSMATWLMTLIITLPLIAYDIKYKANKLVFMHTAIVLICCGIVLGMIVN